MSICIYPLRPEQLLRLGARTALQPLGPFRGRTYHRAPWQLNRAPFDHRSEPHFPPRLGNVHLGQDATAPPAADAPERVSYVLTLDVLNTDTNVSAISTPALPAPCAIADVIVHRFSTSPQDPAEWQLLLTDNPYNGEIDPDVPEKLIIPRTRTQGIGLNPTEQPWGVPIVSVPLGVPTAPYHIGPLGRLITEPGKFLTFAARGLGGATDIRLVCLLTVQRHQAP